MLGSVSTIKPWLDVAYRRRYWILIPALSGLVGGAVVLSQMSKVYMAVTMIGWKQQIIPQGYVAPTVSTGVLDRLSTLSLAMTTRPWLEPLARELKMIKPEAKEPQIAAAVWKLQNKVTAEIDVTRPPRYFMIKVKDPDAKLAADIANNLASKVVNQNADIRLQEAETAVNTAKKFRDDLKVELDQKQDQIARYKSNKQWELPDQLGPNMQLLNGAQMRISSIENDIRTLNDRINIIKMTPEPLTVVPGTGAAVAADPAVARYEQLKRELADLLTHNTELHPDVKSKRVELDAWVKANPQVLATPAPPPTDGTPKGLSPNELQIASLMSQIKQLEVAKQSAEAQLGTLTGRINLSPTRQQEMEALTRGLDPLQQQYNVWVQRVTEAERSLELEKAKQGEQFEIQEQAYPPMIPYSPVPYQVILAGLGIGLALGIGISFLLEFMDNSVRSEEEFLTAFPDLPLLASIPDLDRAARSRRRKSSGRRRAAAA